MQHQLLPGRQTNWQRKQIILVQCSAPQIHVLVEHLPAEHDLGFVKVDDVETAHIPDSRQRDVRLSGFKHGIAEFNKRYVDGQSCNVLTDLILYVILTRVCYSFDFLLTK